MQAPCVHCPSRIFSNNFSSEGVRPILFIVSNIACIGGGTNNCVCVFSQQNKNSGCYDNL